MVFDHGNGDFLQAVAPWFLLYLVGSESTLPDGRVSLPRDTRMVENLGFDEIFDVISVANVRNEDKLQLFDDWNEK